MPDGHPPTLMWKRNGENSVDGDGDLIEFQLDRSLAAEHRDDDADLVRFFVDGGDRAGEVGDRTGDDAHAVADLVGQADACFLVLLVDAELGDFFFGQRDGLDPGPTNPVTPRVLRTTCQLSSVMIILTRT